MYYSMRSSPEETSSLDHLPSNFYEYGKIFLPLDKKKTTLFRSIWVLFHLLSKDIDSFTNEQHCIFKKLRFSCIVLAQLAQAPFANKILISIRSWRELGLPVVLGSYVGRNA